MYVCTYVKFFVQKSSVRPRVCAFYTNSNRPSSLTDHLVDDADDGVVSPLVAELMQ